jgi:threonine/homoserine/homoserine lactone efflux protein
VQRHALVPRLAAFTAKAAIRQGRFNQMWRWINRALGGLFIYVGVRVALLQAR